MGILGRAPISPDSAGALLVSQHNKEYFQLNYCMNGNGPPARGADGFGDSPTAGKESPNISAVVSNYLLKAAALQLGNH